MPSLWTICNLLFLPERSISFSLPPTVSLLCVIKDVFLFAWVSLLQPCPLLLLLLPQLPACWPGTTCYFALAAIIVTQLTTPYIRIAPAAGDNQLTGQTTTTTSQLSPRVCVCVCVEAWRYGSFAKTCPGEGKDTHLTYTHSNKERNDCPRWEPRVCRKGCEETKQEIRSVLTCSAI